MHASEENQLESDWLYTFCGFSDGHTSLLRALGACWGEEEKDDHRSSHYHADDKEEEGEKRGARGWVSDARNRGISLFS